MSLGTILGKIAPELEAGLSLAGGPFGAIGAMAVKAVAGVVAPNAVSPTVDELNAALAGATPDQLLQLQKLNNDFKLKTEEMNLHVIQLQQEQEANDVADRKSARDLAKARGFWPQICISAGFLLGYFAIIVLLFTNTVKLDPSLHDVAIALLGVLTAAVPQILNFWFGSTHGSQKKDAALQAALAP